MKQQLMPSSMSTKHKLFYVTTYWTVQNDKEKCHVDIQEWSVRSIRCKRGALSKWGVKRSYQDSTRYVNIIQVLPNVTIDKNKKWLKSISACYRKQFMFDNERLPYGFYTSKRKAIEHAIFRTKKSLAIWVDMLEEEKDDPDETELNIQGVNDTKREMSLLQGCLTKHIKSQKAA